MDPCIPRAVLSLTTKPVGLRIESGVCKGCVCVRGKNGVNREREREGELRIQNFITQGLRF